MKAGYVFENAELHAYPALFSCVLVGKWDCLPEQWFERERGLGWMRKN